MKSFELGEMAMIIRGVTFSKTEGSKVPSGELLPVIRAGSIQSKLHLDHDLVWVPKKKIKPSQLIKENDIIMCTSSGSAALVGKSAIAERDWEGSFGAFCAGIRSNPKKCVPAYLFHFLNSPRFRDWARNSSGANIKNIRISELESFRVPSPPLSEQMRIAEVLDKALLVQAKRTQSIRLSEQFLKSIFFHLFGDLAENPMKWRSVKVGDLINQGPTNGIYKPASEYGEGCRILRIDGFYDGRIVDPKNFKKVRLSEKEINKYQLSEGSIVINRVNSREYLGKCAVVEGLDEPTVFESNMMNFSVDQRLAVPRFIVDQLCSRFVKNQILTYCKDAVNQSSINQQDVKSIQVRLPPVRLQRRYEEIAKHCFKSVERMREQLDDLQRLYRATAHSVFNGIDAE